MRIIVLAALISVGAGPAFAQGTGGNSPPPIRPGLWQVQGESGAIDTVQRLLSNSPPDQRAKMEQAMKKGGIDVSGGQVRVCLSRESIAAGRWMQDPQPPGGSCQARYERPTATHWTWNLSCSQPAVNSRGEVQFMSDTAYRVDSSTTMTQAGQTTSTRSSLTSTWLSADCGGMNPMPAR